MSAPQFTPPVKAPDPWAVIDYEVDVFRGLCNLLASDPPPGQRPPDRFPIPNAITEAACLHARILVEFILDRGHDTDIKRKQLVGDFGHSTIEKLKTFYSGKDENDPNGKEKRYTAKWLLDKLIAHPCEERGTNYDYSPMLMALRDKIEPALEAIYAERHRRAAEAAKAAGREYTSPPSLLPPELTMVKLTGKTSSDPDPDPFRRPRF